MPVNERMSGARPSPTPGAAPPARPLDIEILQDAETWRLTADIPGVAEDEIRLTREGGALVIETTGARRYKGRADLPDGVALDDIGLSLRNGILELSCPSGGTDGG